MYIYIYIYDLRKTGITLKWVPTTKVPSKLYKYEFPHLGEHGSVAFQVWSCCSLLLLQKQDLVTLTSGLVRGRVLDDRQHILKRWIQPVLGQVLEP